MKESKGDGAVRLAPGTIRLSNQFSGTAGFPKWWLLETMLVLNERCARLHEVFLESVSCYVRPIFHGRYELLKAFLLKH